MSNLVKRKSKPLTFRQRACVNLLIAYNGDIPEVARVLKVKRGRIQRWLKKPKFIELFSSEHKKYIGLDDTRKEHINFVMGRLYNELIRKVSNPEDLANLPISTLIRDIGKLDNVKRLENNQPTSIQEGRVDHVHQVEVRFEESMNSGIVNLIPARIDETGEMIFLTPEEFEIRKDVKLLEAG